MHATHRVDLKKCCHRCCTGAELEESYREDPLQIDITENPMTEVNAVKNFLKKYYL